MYVTDSIRLVYGLYMGLVIAFFAWFAFKVRARPKGLVHEPRHDRIHTREKVFFGILVTAVLAAHAITLSPWVPWQTWRLWSDPEPVQSFDIDVSGYAFHLPDTPLRVRPGQFVEFNVTSQDVTYGFGVFRKDGSPCSAASAS
jgi:cytochrome c oxidase subunit 2